MIIGKTRLGTPPGIGRVGWTDQISLAGNATLRARITAATLPGNALLSLLTLMDELPGNALLSERVVMDSLPGNAELIRAIVLHGNANLMRTITADALYGNALLSERITLDALPGNGLLSERITMDSLPGNAVLRASYYLIMTGNAHLSERITMAALAGSAYLSTQVVMSALTGNGLLGARTTMDSLDGNAILVDQVTVTLHGNAYLVDPHYWALGPADDIMELSGMVADPNPSGFGIKTESQGIPGGRRVSLLDSGLEGGRYDFDVYLSNDSDRVAFQELINNDAEDYHLHIGRSDRFYFVKKIATNPEKIKTARGPVQKVTCWMEDPGMYHAVNQGVNLGACVLPQSTTSAYNFGTMEAPILFKIGGFYSAGQLTLPYVKVLDGATVKTSLPLGAGLLSNEYAELTLDGWHKHYLTHTYSDSFATNEAWQYDATQSGCSLAGGQVSVPSGGWFYYRFQGHPLKKNIKLVATITPTGSPIIQYSTDGSTWYTAVAATEIVSGIEATYWLTGTEKKSTVYVRFYSPTGSSMTVQAVAFTLERDHSAHYLQRPVCPVGETRTVQVTGSGSAKAKIETKFRCRWHAQ